MVQSAVIDLSSSASESEGESSYRARNRNLATELRERVALAARGGADKHRERHVAPGQAAAARHGTGQGSTEDARSTLLQRRG